MNKIFKLAAIILTISIGSGVVSACKSDTSEETAVSVQETSITETIVEAEPDPESTDSIEYLYDPYTLVSDHYSEPYLDEYELNGQYHVPWINLISTDVTNINSEIAETVLETFIDDGISYHRFNECNYTLLCVDETLVSLVIDGFYGCQGWYHEIIGYTFNAVTGDQLTNDEILEYAGLTESDCFDSSIIGTGRTLFLGTDGNVLFGNSPDESIYDYHTGETVPIDFNNGVLTGSSASNSTNRFQPGDYIDIGTDDYEDYLVNDYSFAEDGLSGDFDLYTIDYYSQEFIDELSVGDVILDDVEISSIEYEDNYLCINGYLYFFLQESGYYYLEEPGTIYATHYENQNISISPEVIIIDSTDPFGPDGVCFDPNAEQIDGIQAFEDLLADENTWYTPGIFIRVADGEIKLIVINPLVHQPWRDLYGDSAMTESHPSLTYEQAHEAFSNYFESICYRYDGQDPQYYFDEADSDNYTCVYQFRYYWGAQAHYSIFHYMDLTTGSVRTQEYEEIPDDSAATPSEGSEEVLPGIWFVGYEYNVFNAWDYLPESEAEGRNQDDAVVVDIGSGDYHVPKIQINSDYAEEINDEIYSLYLSDEGSEFFWASKYIVFLTDDGYLSLVFVEKHSWDLDEFHVYNIDTNTGEQITNEQIAQAAGISSIRQSAMDAAQAYLNNSGIAVISNYQIDHIVEDYGMGDSFQTEYANMVDMTFSEDNLNNNMPIGLTDYGEIFFISEMASPGGGGHYYQMYDSNGNDLSQLDSWVSGV